MESVPKNTYGLFHVDTFVRFKASTNALLLLTTTCFSMLSKTLAVETELLHSQHLSDILKCQHGPLLVQASPTHSE
jgi:hypothetical protein